MKSNLSFSTLLLSSLLAPCLYAQDSFKPILEDDSSGIIISVISIGGERQVSDLLIIDEELRHSGDLVFFMQTDRRAIPMINKNFLGDEWSVELYLQEDVGEAINRSLLSVPRGSCFLIIELQDGGGEGIAIPVDRLTETRVFLSNYIDIDLFGILVRGFSESDANDIISRLGNSDVANESAFETKE